MCIGATDEIKVATCGDSFEDRCKPPCNYKGLRDTVTSTKYSEAVVVVRRVFLRDVCSPSIDMHVHLVYNLRGNSGLTIPSGWDHLTIANEY